MRTALTLGTCLLLFALFGDEHGVRAIFQARRETRVLSAQIAMLRAENASMRRRADALRGDPATIEEAARETLGLAKQGEIVVIPHRRDGGVRPLGR